MLIQTSSLETRAHRWPVGPKLAALALFVFALFRQTAKEGCSPEGAVWVIERAERIAFSIHANVEDAKNHYGRGGLPPRL